MNSSIFDTYHPDGFHSMNAYLFVEDPERLIDFCKSAFEAKEVGRTLNEANEIANCILTIGDSSFMISQAREQFLGMRSAHYLYVNDVDSVYQRALEYGAKSEFPPTDMDYGDRQAGVCDPSGSYWWISKRLSEEGYH